MESIRGPCRHGAEALPDVLPGQSIRGCLELAYYPSIDAEFATEECRCYGGGAGVREWDGFRPTSEVVDARQQVVVTRRVWERADEVDMDVLEASLLCFETLERRLDVHLHFVVLALEACAGPFGHI